MATYDLSRSATDFRKRYSGVRMQQGRVLMDDDFNEAERLDAEDARRVGVDVIGPAGSPDDGFRLNVPTTGQLKDKLVLSAGSFYVGGLRLELENDEAFNEQKDWLQQGSGPGETLTAPPGPQFDFVWLDVWQQPVSAVEDKELFEVALGGADTSVRIRTMRRARVLPNVGDVDCADAWAKLLVSLNTQGTLNGDFELVPDTSLKVEPEGTAPPDDLCSPPITGGYLGAENQAIRVQIVDNNQFTWGFDNGAPLYRVKLVADNNGLFRKIHMLTVPKDQAHYPLEGQVVELLPWSALLSNGQKNAELSGFMAKVDGGYNPDTQDLRITAAPDDDTGSPPLPFGQRWSARSDAAAINNEDPPDDGYFYMRVWNRGADTTSPAAIGFVPDAPVSLAKTGLQVTFSGTNLRKNDFWIIAVRPETPNAVVPWKLSAGRAAHGVRRWIAPLGVIHWPGGGARVEVVDDCRPTFVPLTAGWWGGGCSVIVAPRPGWDRVFSLFQPGQDVSICFQAGDYHVDRTLVVDKLRTFKMTGAGSGTRIIASGCESAFLFQGCGSVLVRELHIETGAAPVGRETAEQHLNGVLTFLNCDDVRVSDCDLVCPDSAGRQQSCLTVRSKVTSARDLVRIERNRLTVGAWQIGILLVDVDRSNVSGNHLSLSKTMPPKGWRAIPGFLAGPIEQLVLEAISPTATPGSYGLSFTKSDSKLQVLKGAVAEPLVRDFAKLAPKNVAKAPGGVDGALRKFVRGVAAGHHISALSKASQAAIGKIIEELRAGGQGIVVAGTRIGTVQIVENVVEDMIQGIHVGVSNPTIAGPEIADEIMIARNVVHSMVPQLFNRDRHAIFVGNARSIIITDTVASLRLIGRPMKERKQVEVEGIRIHGVLGPFLVIRQSSLNGFTIGVRIVPLDPVPVSKQRVWLVAETMATGASKTLDAPSSIESERNYP
jgi:hypothetical protein